MKTNSPNAALDAAYNFHYQYDQVGNRLHEDRGQMDLDGTFNPLNQLIYLNYSGFLDVYGTVTGTNSPFMVKVNGQSAALYNTSNFLGGAKVKAGTNTISIVVRDSTGTNQYNLVRKPMGPPTNPQQFVYDLNGNVTNDGRVVYFWNEENRLNAIEGISAFGSRYRSEYQYDAQSRRIAKVDYSGFTNGTYSVSNRVQFIYDGWNLVQEVSHSDTPSLNYTNTFIWGLDLSQSLQGAGGVGGLLCVIKNGVPYFPCYDGNGNISDYVSTNGVVVAHREYDPFGNTVVSTGPMKDAFNFWFSTKYYEPTWRTYYYGYRYYSPSLGRWLSRDPIGENGGMNLYSFAFNTSVNVIDPLGLEISGPAVIVVYDKTYAKKKGNTTTYSLDKKCASWSVEGSVAEYDHSSLKIRVYPTHESPNFEDTTITATFGGGLTETKQVTVIRPKYLTRDFDDPVRLTMRPIMDAHLHIFDQFDNPFPAGVAVTERINATTLHNVARGVSITGGTTTSSGGSLKDTFSCTFLARDAWMQVDQTIRIGDWEAPVNTRLEAFEEEGIPEVRLTGDLRSDFK